MLIAVIATAAATAVLLTGLQLALPRVAEARIRARLTEGGGSADVLVRSFPATRLLANGGDRLVVRGAGLTIGLAGDAPPAAPAASPPAPAGLSALDGFDEVDIEILDFSAGPFRIAAFVLARGAEQTYVMATAGSVAAAELAAFGLAVLGELPAAGRLPGAGALPASALIESVARPALGSRELGFSVELELISADGRLQVGAGGGTLAGLPAGPLATAIAAAVARRLEIVP